jgi:DNA-3-methyladenine glycosylase
MAQIQFNKKLTKNFYKKDPVILAPQLLGKIIARKHGNKYLTGKIVEVEAYRDDDEAAHTFNGKTKRNEVMFREGGFLYVYFTYGMHFCSNIVCGKVNQGAAVLIRAVEPLEGIDEMIKNRYSKKNIADKDKINLTNGPAKFCEAFAIKREENGLDLNSESIFLIRGSRIPKNKVAVTTRIGIRKSIDLPWRFYIKDNPYVSKL